MKALKAVSSISFMALVFATSASAQGPGRGVGGPMGGMMGGPQLRGIFNPIVGSGAQYEINRGGDNGRKMTMDIVTLGKESVEGKDGYWLEVTIYGTEMGDVVDKILVVPDGSDVRISNAVMQIPGHPPMQMPQMGRMGQKQLVDIRNEATDLGGESVTTPAGTFSTEHYRTKKGDGEFWISEKVSPYGLVKYQGKDKDDTIVLTKTISDAKDKITGTPVPFNPMMMGRPGAQQP
jgi:hypothetical protein